jgi:hypothetical protein
MNMFEIIEKQAYPPLNLSKWLKQQVLFDLEEVQQLFLEVPEIKLFNIGQVQPLDKCMITLKEFVGVYRDYLTTVLSNEEFKHQAMLSLAIAPSCDFFKAMKVKEDQYLLRPKYPFIQMQKHNFIFSERGEILSMVKSADAISFGLQFSCPVIFQDPVTKKVININKDSRFDSLVQLQKKIFKYIRSQSKPLEINLQGKIVKVPIRLGLRCQDWIQKHPKLKQFLS